jgi:hypothetical protein
MYKSAFHKNQPFLLIPNLVTFVKTYQEHFDVLKQDMYIYIK